MLRRVFSSVSVRASSAALVAALLFALGGVYAIDHAMAESVRAQFRVGAVESAALLESFLATHAEALRSIRGLYLDSTSTAGDEQFRALVRSMSEFSPSFRRLWVADSAGMIHHEYVFGSPIPLPGGVDTGSVDTVGFPLAATARSSRRIQISRPQRLLDGERGVVMVEPLFRGTRFMGYAAGSISARSILRSVEARHPYGDGQLVLVAGGGAGDTIGATRAVSQVVRDAATAEVQTPGAAVWRVSIVEPRRYDDVRLLLWAVGLAALGALVVALLHERRQGLRLAARSAELERLSGELLRANRAKSEFLANVSHELRTPLNAIVGFVDLLRDGVYGELAPRQVAPVGRIASSATHLRQLVDQVLDLAKMAAGRLEVRPESIDLRSFVLDVASESEALVNERGLALSIAIGRTLPRVRTDPMHLRQILVNLIGNAVKFTPSGGIAIRAHVVDRRGASDGRAPGGSHGVSAPAGAGARLWIALEVADTGIGIPPADRGRVFEEFEQVDAGPRTDSAQRGTGLGLAISRRLARLLGGDLTLESEWGKGSTFTVWIPAEPRREEPHSPAMAPELGVGEREGALERSGGAKAGRPPPAR